MWLTEQEAAEYLGITRAALAKRRSRGTAPKYVRQGNWRTAPVMYVGSYLDEYLAEEYPMGDFFFDSLDASEMLLADDVISRVISRKSLARAVKKYMDTETKAILMEAFSAESDDELVHRLHGYRVYRWYM